jgi:hypothetical protein
MTVNATRWQRRMTALPRARHVGAVRTPSDGKNDHSVPPGANRVVRGPPVRFGPRKLLLSGGQELFATGIRAARATFPVGPR